MFMRKSSLMVPARIFCLILVPFLLSTAWAGGPKFTVLHEFAGGATDGGYPYNPLLYHSGNLIGVTGYGGLIADCYSYGCGTAFELSQSDGHWRESVFYDYSPTAEGYEPGPQGPLAIDSKGNLYGVQSQGGDLTCNCGTVYQLTKSAGNWTQNLLHDFLGGSDGQYPYSGVLQDAKGNLYGTTASGGAGYGTIFELSPGTDGNWIYSIIYEFYSNGAPDGQGPWGPLTIDSLGNLYGTTQGGGEYGYGTAFKLSPSDGWSETILYNFSEDYGSFPQPSGVTWDSAGNLYGTTTYDGVYALGTVYKLTPAAGFWNHTVLHTFTGGVDGAYPYQGLAIDSSGALYGTTSLGGIYGYGVVFKFQSTNGKWSESELHAFTNGSDGSRPDGGVTLDPSGDVYGTALEGGTYDQGTAFEIKP
jgi:uncharacterized repeat protein (TIGR03803 family)